MYTKLYIATALLSLVSPVISAPSTSINTNQDNHVLKRNPLPYGGYSMRMYGSLNRDQAIKQSLNSEEDDCEDDEDESKKDDWKEADYEEEKPKSESKEKPKSESNKNSTTSSTVQTILNSSSNRVNTIGTGVIVSLMFLLL